MHARALTLIKDGPPCANRGSLNCTFLASYSAIAPTLADYGERPLRCIQLCQPLASVVLSQQPKEASSLHLPPPVSSSTTLASSMNPIWFTCMRPPHSTGSHLLLGVCMNPIWFTCTRPPCSPGSRFLLDFSNSDLGLPQSFDQ